MPADRSEAMSDKDRAQRYEVWREQSTPGVRCTETEIVIRTITGEEAELLRDQLNDYERRIAAALATSTSARLAELERAARELHEWERGSAARADLPRAAFDESAEIEWDRRVDAVCAALDALDAERGGKPAPERSES